MTDAAAVAIATGAFTLLGTMFSGVIAYFMAKLKLGQDQAATEARDVKETLQVVTAEGREKLGDLAAAVEGGNRTADKIHILVNSSSLAQDKVLAELSRWKAAQTGLPEDIAAADAAEQKYHQHFARQAQVDAQPGSDAAKAGRPDAR